jgi:fructose-bisphosphate aldolase class II
MHGIYAENKHIDFDVLGKMRELCPNTYFSLHGGSGIFDEDVKRAIKEFGIVKVNVNSEMRIAFKMTLQEVLNDSTEIAAYKIMEKPIDEVRKVVEGKIKLFTTH